MRAFEILLTLVAAWLASGTLLSLSTWSHWYVRGWDFPRLGILLLAVATGILHAALFWDRSTVDILVAASMAAVALWQAIKIAPYLPPLPNMVMKARARDLDLPKLRIVVSNVLMENEQHDRWLQVVRAAKPDVLIALETNARWIKALAPLREEFAHHVERPQENYYGMALYSQRPLVDCEVRFLVQDDIPSIHTRIGIESGEMVWLHAIHPRPPEPLRNQDSTPRDSELVLMAKEIGKAPDLPRIVAGDLNDVAWSYTTTLFLRLSGMLDPRRGRGLYSTFDCRKPKLFRWPLDHVFHTTHFTIGTLELLGQTGSDHFPVCIDLVLQPKAKEVQEASAMTPTSNDRENADEILQREPPQDRPPVS